MAYQEVTRCVAVLVLCVGVVNSYRVSGYKYDAPACTIECTTDNYSELYMDKHNNNKLPTKLRRCSIRTKEILPLCEIDINQHILADDITTDNNIVLISYITCESPTRIRIRSDNVTVPMKNLVTLLQAVNCDMYWTDMDVLGNVVDLRSVVLANWSDSYEKELELGYFNKTKDQRISVDHGFFTLPKGLHNIVSMSILNPRPPGNKLPGIFRQFLWPNLGELDLTGVNFNIIPPQFQQSMPFLQTLEIHDSFISDPGSFPWVNSNLILPGNLSRTNSFDRHYNSDGLSLGADEFRRIFLLEQSKVLSLVGVSFSGHLQVISLKENVIENYDDDTFSHLEDLEIINLSSNNISVLRSNSFSVLPKLREIKLDGNQIWKLEKIFCLECQNLKSVNLSNNVIRTIASDTFTSLSAIREIDLSNNEIEHLSENIGLSTSTSLKKLKLGNNKLSIIPSWMFSTRNLQQIDLGGNLVNWESLSQSIAEINVNNFKLQNRISGSDYDNGQINCYKPGGERKKLSLTNMTTLQTIDIKSMYNETYIMFKYVLKCFHVDFTGSHLHCDDKMYGLYDWFHNLTEQNKASYYETFEYHKTNIKCYSPPKLSGIAVYDVPEEAFLHCKTMDNCPLNCSCCERSIDREIVVDCSARNLTNFPSILPRNTKYLFVDSNRIQRLDCSYCDYLASVQTIHLQNNRIVNISDNFINNLPSLVEINLMENMVTHFPKSLTKLPDADIYLSGNPIDCDCYNRWMKEWLLFNILQVKDYHSIYCASGKPKGKLVIKADDDDFICDITLSQVHQSLIIATAVIIILLMIIIIVAYKYRGEIKLLMFVHFNWHPFDRSENADITDMEYDVFLSYSGHDDRWVLHELLPKLEDHKPPYRVCIHDRDFELGAAIQENILNSVKNSRRMIMVLTKNYLESDWCLYEFRVAYDKVINDRTNYLILILADDVTIDDVEEEMKLYLRTNTYIQMNKSYLWDKILYAMPHKPLCGINKQLKPLIYPKLVKHSGHSELELNFQMSVMSADSGCPDMELRTPMESDILLRTPTKENCDFTNGKLKMCEV